MKNLFNSIKDTLHDVKIPSILNIIVIAYAVLVGVVAFLWVAHWLGYFPNAGSLAELTGFIQTLVASNTVNCVYSIAKGLVDKDGNGIPDAFEERKSN